MYSSRHRDAPAATSGPIRKLTEPSAALELLRFLGSLGRISGAVRVSAGSSELAAIHYEVLIANRTLLEPALQNFTRSCCIARLCRKRGAGGMRRHPMVRHRPPRMVLRRGLREPHVACIPGELTRLQRADDRVAVTDLPAGRVDDIRAALHLVDERLIEEILRLRVQWGVDRDDVTHASH